jgi:hypothetical protein
MDVSVYSDCNKGVMGMTDWKRMYTDVSRMLDKYQNDVVPKLREQLANRVEVVRCKDCKYGIWNEEEQMWQCVYSAELDEGIGEYFGFFEYNEGEHFCSRGERRTDV